MMKYVSGVWRELLLQGLTALLAKQPVTGNEVKLNFAFPLLSMSLEWLWFLFRPLFSRKEWRGCSRGSEYLCSVRAGERTAASCREVGEWDRHGEGGRGGWMYHKEKERQQRKRVRGEMRKRQFSIQSPSTLRDELIYCQIWWWIIDNLSQAPQSTHSAIAAQTEPWARSGSRDINIKEIETEERVCLFCVCMCPKYSQTEGVFLPRELEGGRGEGLQFSTWTDFNLHTHPPLWLHPPVVIDSI